MSRLMTDFEKQIIEKIKGSKIKNVKKLKGNKVQFVVLHEKYRELDERLTKEDATEEFYQELKKMEGGNK